MYGTMSEKADYVLGIFATEAHGSEVILLQAVLLQDATCFKGGLGLIVSPSSMLCPGSCI